MKGYLASAAKPERVNDEQQHFRFDGVTVARGGEGNVIRNGIDHERTAEQKSSMELVTPG